MRVKHAIGLFLLLPAFWGMAMAREAMTRAQAAYAAAASIRLIPGSDIEFGHHAHILALAEFDKKQGPQIVYLLTAFNTGSTFDATNELMVMTRLEEGDKRGISSYPGTSEVTDQDYAEIRRSGYADDVGVHIPGEVSDLQIRGDNIVVRFHSKEDSPICKRFSETSEGSKATHCPLPGWHTWIYAWTPGKLERVGCEDGSGVRVQCNPDQDVSR